MTTRADRKADYQAYREAAQQRFAVNSATEITTLSPFGIVVPVTAGVSLCEDGAYVDAVIWVPRAVMERSK